MIHVRQVIAERIRAALQKAFPDVPCFLASEREPEPETPWVIIEAVLAKGRADGLNDRQLAGGVYTVLVDRGLIVEDRS